tara:strand:- start:79075 stop:79866 length:792 start_codon:yes stop_codon:yes gene_type:complete
MKHEDSKSKLVPALERGTRILDLIARSRSYPSLSQIAREVGIPKSSAHTLCNTLIQLELLIRRPDQTFQLGPHVMRWSNAFTQQSDVAAEFAAMWDQETEFPGATITLSVLDGAEVVYIAARNSAVSHSLIDFKAGMRLPAAFTATGKAFLSHMSDFEVRRIFADGLPEQRTPHSVTSLEDLISDLQSIRKNGYSLDDQQVAEGIVCYGASVLDSRNKPMAGIAVSVQAEQVSEAEKKRIISNVQRMAARLSVRMGADMKRSA